MADRPILMSAPMVRATLREVDPKTQTRRVAKGVVARHSRTGEPLAALDSAGPRVRCPYGQPGDRLWVREAWRTIAEADALPPRELTPAHRLWFEADAPHQPRFGKLRPGMFMPRWASRITLDITGVRVERLQDISESDAEAEGVYTDPACPAYDAYRKLWDQINGPGSWNTNPWVWVVEFTRAKP
jgi:hypothetical protein